MLAGSPLLFVCSSVVAMLFACQPSLGENAIPAKDRLDISGTWSIRLDEKNVGEYDRWFAEPLGEQSIPLPGTTDQAGYGYRLDRETMTYPVPVLRTQWPNTAKVQKANQAGHLVRDWLYVGKAWYQRPITIPENWKGKHVQLLLERVTWESKVYLDDRFVGTCDSLAAEHRFDLGELSPGVHRLTVRVDNGMAHNIGIISHSYGPETQSRWNGIVGRIELIATDSVYAKQVDYFPAADRRSVGLKLHVANKSGSAATGTVTVSIYADGGSEDDRVVVGSLETPIRASTDGDEIALTVPITKPVQPWDEFHPVRYVAEVRLNVTAGGRSMSHTVKERFGFRHIQRDVRAIMINGRRVFLRGTLDCCVFPNTGYPPTTVDAWREVLGTIKEHGFNHVRFHSWCPPEAAFEAADQLGIYLGAETCFWVDDWTANTSSRPGRLGQDADVVEFIRREIRRMSDAYGNHPSFAFFCIGNEFGNKGTDWNIVNQLIAEAKQRDPRRLYNASTARRRVSADDFWVTHHTGKAGTRGIGPAHTNWDFSAAVASTDLPLVGHETGQRPVFPDYDQLLPKFRGPLKPYNLIRLRNQLADAGMMDQVKDFERASARFQLIQYKAEHEAMLRTPDYAGYQLLMLNDFTGQAEALVGILDAFWQSKGVISVKEVRQWNSPTVPLARIDRFTWTTDETFEAMIEVSHFGPLDLERASATWTLTTPEGNRLADGKLGPLEIKTGGLTRFGQIKVSLSKLTKATALTLRVEVGDAANQWTIWVYPPENNQPEAGDVLIAHRFDEVTEKALADGRRVLLLAHGLKNEYAASTQFPSVYWSAGWGNNRFSSLGILCDPRHLALAKFPNDGHSDWQWYELNNGATTFDLTDLARDLNPIVQTVPDFHHNRLLANVFDTRCGEGKLVVCGYDLSSRLKERHAARQLYRSILMYMKSDAFDPPIETDLSVLRKLLLQRAATSNTGD